MKQSAHEHFLTVAEHVYNLKKEVKELREEKNVVGISDASLIIMEVGELTIACIFYNNYVIGVHIAAVHIVWPIVYVCTKYQPTL